MLPKRSWMMKESLLSRSWIDETILCLLEAGQMKIFLTE